MMSTKRKAMTPPPEAQSRMKTRRGIITHRANFLAEEAQQPTQPTQPQQEPYVGSGEYADERIAKLASRKINVEEVAAGLRECVFDGFVQDHRKHPPQKLLQTKRLAEQAFVFQAYFPRFAWRLEFFQAFQAKGWTEHDLAEDYPNKPRSLLLPLVARADHSRNMLKIAGSLVGSYLATPAEKKNFYVAFKDEEFAKELIKSLLLPLFLKQDLSCSMLQNAGPLVGSFLKSNEKKKFYKAFHQEGFVDELIEMETSPFFLGLWFDKHCKLEFVKRGLDLGRLDCCAVEEVRSRFLKYPNHPMVGKENAVSILIKIATRTKEQRREELTQALSSQGLELESRGLCWDYIQGYSGRLLWEVVGYMKLSRFFCHIDKKSRFVYKKKRLMREKVFEQGYETWQSAWESIMEGPPPRHQYHY